MEGWSGCSGRSGTCRAAAGCWTSASSSCSCLEVPLPPVAAAVVAAAAAAVVDDGVAAAGCGRSR